MMKSQSKAGLTRRSSIDFNADGPTMPMVIGDLKSFNQDSLSSGLTLGGELAVTLASALLLFAHFGITLYKIESNHPETSIGKKHLKDRWLLINLCILVFALASHLYRNALNNLKIKMALAVLVPDLVTAGVIFLILTKHVFFALYLLMAGVTFLSVAVTCFDVYAYFNPSDNMDVSDQFSVSYKKDYDEMDDSIRSSTSTLSLSSLSVHSRAGSVSSVSEIRRPNHTRDNSESIAQSLANGFRSLASSVSTSSPRKKATRSVLRKPPKKSIWESA